jgi:hypothetical protein
MCLFIANTERGIEIAVKAIPLDSLGSPLSTQVHAGLHAYTNKKRASEYPSPDRIIVECIIPKGTKFIRGKHEEIVSLRLKVGRAIHGNANLVKAFNKKSPGA